MHTELGSDQGRGQVRVRQQGARHLELLAAKRWRAAQRYASGASSSQPCACSLADEVGFELGESGEQMEGQLAGSGGGVDGLA